MAKSYMKEAPTIHANRESSSTNGSQPISLGRTYSQRAKTRDIDGSPSSKQQQIDVSQTDLKTHLSGHANGESSSTNGSSAKSNGSGEDSLRRMRSKSAKEREIGGSPSSKQRKLDVSQTDLRPTKKRKVFVVFVRKYAKPPSKVIITVIHEEELYTRLPWNQYLAFWISKAQYYRISGFPLAIQIWFYERWRYMHNSVIVSVWE
ncbi:uncharacterized protein [Nicotiana sylvestris]|uniref:Uncharacterized protein LOC104212445 n=1 Tax=Nicotiana sylvestris TaxID=4096 RepID=A0A1U7VDV6_NICSY|nr:PREDICTED: uncharacterized protein LOC104212445 [Nicotiana sylvestris]